MISCFSSLVRVMVLLSLWAPPSQRAAQGRRRTAATAAAGAEVLSAGGNAADAAVAATLASCVAETMMTGLLGGGHAVYFDRASGRSWNLDCFCGVPSGKGGDLVELQVPFGEELVH